MWDSGTLISSFCVWILSCIRLQLNEIPVIVEMVFGVVSLGQCMLLLLMAYTHQIYVAYICFVLFRVSFVVTVAMASYQIALHVEKNMFALVFGCNTFVALALQCLMTFVVADRR